MNKGKIKEIVANVLGWTFVIVIIVLFFIGLRSCWNTYGKGYSWKCDVDVAYVYENDSVEHHIKHIEQFYSNRSNEWIDVTFATPAGYNNVLILYSDVSYSGRSHHCFQKELMRVPDRKFKVTDVKWKLGERQDK